MNLKPVLLCASLLTTPGWAANITYDTYVAHKNGPAMTGQLYGLAWGVMAANGVMFNRTGQKLFCIPDDVRIGSDFVGEILDAEVKRSPNSRILPIENLYMGGIMAKYPCPTPAGQR
ncbi:hypothetical protein [Hydrogenophaga sp. 2FB]|uniref:hypothetical protein n=1 Tax=Hydrogenophaga sp. 2FB TaxID=2502187 RepID=UPI0010FA3F21|nr:hypothetical protein [Hydrogenophaga sp. 2FB]